MKKFFLKLMIFFVIVAAIDAGYGFYCDYYRRHVKDGMTRMDNIAAYETRADILIFGSSRARRHYDTRILSDSLGMSCFNCGFNSLGINFFSFRLQQILERYTPKMIIYDITPHYDMMQTDGTQADILGLKPYFHDARAYAKIREANMVEWIKCHMATYRFHDAIEEYRADDKSRSGFINGYAPLKGTWKIKEQRHDQMTKDSAKMRMLEELMATCQAKGLKLIFVLSPYYHNDMGDLAAGLRPLAQRYGVPVIDHFNDSAFINSDSLYRDASHLNARGATAFTTALIPELKPHL